MWNIEKYEPTEWNQHHECLNREHRICEFVIWTQQTTKHINQLLKFNTVFPHFLYHNRMQNVLRSDFSSSLFFILATNSCHSVIVRSLRPFIFIVVFDFTAYADILCVFQLLLCHSVGITIYTFKLLPCVFFYLTMSTSYTRKVNSVVSTKYTNLSCRFFF